MHRFLFPRIKESRGIDLLSEVEHKEGEYDHRALTSKVRHFSSLQVNRRLAPLCLTPKTLMSHWHSRVTLLCTPLLHWAQIMKCLMVTNLSTTIRKASILSDKNFLFFVTEPASLVSKLIFLSNSLGFGCLSTVISMSAKT